MLGYEAKSMNEVCDVVRTQLSGANGAPKHRHTHACACVTAVGGVGETRDALRRGAPSLSTAALSFPRHIIDVVPDRLPARKVHSHTHGER